MKDLCLTLPPHYSLSSSSTEAPFRYSNSSIIQSAIYNFYGLCDAGCSGPILLSLWTKSKRQPKWFQAYNYLLMSLLLQGWRGKKLGIFIDYPMGQKNIHCTIQKLHTYLYICLLGLQKKYSNRAPIFLE